MIKVAGHPRTVFKRKFQSLFIIKKKLLAFIQKVSHISTPSLTRQARPSLRPDSQIHHAEKDRYITFRMMIGGRPTLFCLNGETYESVPTAFLSPKGRWKVRIISQNFKHAQNANHFLSYSPIDG